MKKFTIILLSITLVIASPIKNGTQDEDEPEDGWFVPQADGSLEYVTEEEAQLNMRALTMARAKKPEEVKVKFYLYTKLFPLTAQEIFIDDITTLKYTSFDSGHQTRIIIHGWQNNYKSDVNKEIREALFSVGEFNVISVDWSDIADRYNYYAATTAIPKVGQKVAHLIEFLRDEGNMKSKDLKVIGHSLGAHVAGYAGKLIEGDKIQTIIGLDTAFPLFKYENCKNRLCKTDALYVESIHTNGRLLGFIQPIGHTAFYPNGGKTQPGCGIDVTGTCSHSRAYTYYAEAVKMEFLGLKCNNWKDAVQKDCRFNGQRSVARLDSALNPIFKEGSFYSPVNNNSPYGLQT